MILISSVLQSAYRPLINELCLDRFPYFNTMLHEVEPARITPGVAENDSMRLMIAFITVLCMLVAPAFAETAKELIEKVTKIPGYDNQNCRGPGPKRPRDRLPLFGYNRPWADEIISPENFQKLRAQRKQVLQELAIQLDAINVQKSAKDFNKGQSIMKIKRDLNGVEALAALLRLEKAFAQGASYSEKGMAKAEEPYPAHVQILSTITAVLQQERAAGLDQLGKTATYDRKHRDLIVKLAENFQRNVDPSQYRREAGMAAKPLPR